MESTAAQPNAPFPIDARAILESMGDAFYALDAEWRFVYANRRALDFWKLPREHLLGRVIWECLPQLVGTLNEDMLRRARAEQRAIFFEAPSPTTGVWVAVTVSPAGDGVAAYWRDITERIRGEQALRNSEEHLRLAQEAGGIGTWEWDLLGGKMQWSAQMFRLLGREPSEAADLHALLLAGIHPDDREDARAQLDTFRRRPGPLRMELRALWPNGETHWIVFLGRVAADTVDRPVRMLGIAIDGTQRRRGEEAIRNDAERLRIALKAGRLATWDFDLATQTRHWSPEAAVMHGFSPERTEMHRGEWGRFIHPDDVGDVRRRFDAAVATGSDYTAEYRVFGEDGVLRWTSVQGTVVQDSRGRPVRVIGVLHDITARKRAEESLRESNIELEERVREEVAAREAAQARAAHAERMQALGQLAGGIAHDFNNVLQAVSGGATLLERRPTDPDSVRRFARIILDAASRGSSITRRLLAFAHRSDLRAEPVDAGPLLDGLREILEHTLGAGIQVEVEATPGLPPLYADRSQLETVLVNLAANARDAMPSGGRVLLSAAADTITPNARAPGLSAGLYITLSVGDTGTGMDAGTLARASEPFFTTKRQGEGTGLGLAMARGFAEQSGGALRIESRLGEGTRATLWLPQAEEAAGVTTPARAETPTQVSAVARILLADDDQLVRETLSAQLEGLGFSVVAVADGAAALVQMDAGAVVDCLVADLAMPGIDGLALIREAQRKQPRLAAVLLTGFAGDSAALALSGALSGSFSLLRKPVDATQLVDRITMLLEAATVGS